jgi:hypothetical protein
MRRHLLMTETTSATSATLRSAKLAASELGGLARYERPQPVMVDYDQLLLSLSSEVIRAGRSRLGDYLFEHARAACCRQERACASETILENQTRRRWLAAVDFRRRDIAQPVALMQFARAAVAHGSQVLHFLGILLADVVSAT